MSKRLLSIQYPPFIYQDFGKLGFERFGFDIYQCDLGEFSELEAIIDRVIKQDWDMNLADFDAVLIINRSVAEPFDEKLLFPKKEILEFRNRIKIISEQKGKPILFIGIYGGLPEKHYDQQARLFDGLFLSGAMPSQTMEDVVNKIHSFAIDQ
uniref:Uncharacterized protein n=1 Tax=Oscillatoriales cyanobacterium SpSt-402 TaxID=2282168 RepID=A0A832H6C6_9CYAN